MHLGLLTQERLSFEPIKPLILRGPPSENSSSVFTGTVVLSLAKSTKISSITVTFKSTATTYWPEGIGARGTRLTYDKVLSEESVQLLSLKPNEVKKLPTGIHRFSFAFLVPNSIVETIEDVYGRVRHTVDAKVVGQGGIQLLNNWHITKPVLVLRTYMSDSLLTNNSLQDLSRTYEKRLPAADVQLVVERAAFSSGDLFYLKLILQPHRKRVRLEHMQLTVTENRRYHVSEVRANRTDYEQFILPYIACKRIDGDNNEMDSIADKDSGGDLRAVFSKHGRGIELNDTIAYQLTFGTPTCMRNIHHTTYYKDILFKHHLNIAMTISFVDEELTAKANLTRNHSSSSIEGSSSIEEQQGITATPSQPGSAHSSQTNLNTTSNGQQSTTTWFSKLKKPVDVKENGAHVVRKREMIQLETPITVFDCRLKEDYGRLPSYSELNVTATHLAHGDDKSKMMMEQDMIVQRDANNAALINEPQPQLCPCYFKFRRQMDMASQAQLTDNECSHSLEKIPSIPPPDYVEIPNK